MSSRLSQSIIALPIVSALIISALALTACSTGSKQTSEQVQVQKAPATSSSIGSSHSYTYQSADVYAPEHATKLLQQKESDKIREAKQLMVVSAHPLATQAGYEILSKGGNATDAMVAVQTVLGLVEPQSSGLGGGAFLLYYDAQEGRLTTFDGRETAPLGTYETLFINSEGETLGFFEAVLGGKSVGTPGTPKLLWERHKANGKLAWHEVLQPAITLAEQGFEVTPRLASALDRDSARLTQDPQASAYFYPQGQALKAGAKLRIPAYAEVLKQMRDRGGDYFYSPEFAQAIINKVNSHSNPGTLSQRDFDNYQIVERPATCAQVLSYEICGMGPPSSGAITVLQTLKLLEASDFSQLTPESPDAWHHIAEAYRLAFADRGRYIADTDYVEMPSTLLDQSYLSERASLIQETPSENVEPGLPPLERGKTSDSYPRYSGYSPERASTTHFVIVDKDGNVVSMTSTIENGFGSRLMVNGFMLNNELTDFSFSPEKSGQLVANRVQPGKRPRSSMAPTIVFKTDAFKETKPYMALGSPGGSRIINYVGNTLIRTLFWQQQPSEAIFAPHYTNRFGSYDVEARSDTRAIATELANQGYKVNTRDLNSGLHLVQWTSEGLLGIADKRREGSALGH